MKDQGFSKIRSRLNSLRVPILILLTGILLISILYWEARKDALEQLGKQFEIDAAGRSRIISDALEDHLIDLEGLHSFYNASTSVTPKAFAAFVAPTLKTRPGIQAFEWIPRVGYPERAHFEAEARRNGLQDYQIYQLDPKGNKVAVGPHQYYYPAFYVEPLAGNEPARGFDLGSNPASLAALDMAADSGQPVATESLTLLQETGTQAGFLIFIPVYRQEMPLTTAEQRRIALQGFVLGVFRAGDAVEAAVRPSPEKGLLTELVDLYGPVEGRLLYRFERDQSPLKVTTWKTLLAPSVTLRYGHPFTYASRQWRVDITASPAYVQEHISLSYWLIPPLGVLLTLLLTLSFGAFLSRKVAAYARSLIEASLDPMVTISPDGKIMDVNHATEIITGVSREKLIGQDFSEYFTEREKDREGYRQVFSQGMIRNYPLAIRHVSGQITDVIYNASIYTDEAGKVQGVFAAARDITERKRAEEALSKNHRELQETAQRLEQSMNMMQLIIESIPARVFWKDSDLRYLGCNTLFARDAGLNHPQELLGKDDFAMGWRDQADLYRADDRRVMESRRPKPNIIEPQTTPTGAKIWLNTSKVPLQKPNGEVFGVLGVYEDVTERVKAEEAVQEGNETLKALLNAVPESIFLIGAGGVIVAANETSAKRFGKGLDELIGSKIFELLPSEVVKRRKAYTDEAIRTGRAVRFEDLRDGMFLDNFIHPVKDAKGKVSKLAVFSMDITERKRAVKAIKENLRLRQQILDTIPSPIFYKGIDGRYQGVNQAFLRFHGKTMGQVLNKTVHEVFPKEIADQYLRKDQDLFQHPGIQVYEFYNYDAHGQRREMSLHKATFLDKDGSVAGLAGIMIDITEQKKAAEERLRFSKLESLGTLAGGIAHDFNNILTAILGNIGLAMLDGKIETQVRERLAQSEQACLRAKALSQQLLTFAKGGAPIKKIVPIAKLLKESAILMLSGSKSRYEVSIPGDLWSVEGDEGQINQVISNLLINADQAMPGGGIIKITAKNILVEAGSNLPLSMGKYVKFAIADPGIGISAKYLDNIFDPYFSTKQKGSGLGLATAYSIIKNHSGHIQVESQSEVGTTFDIYLPATDKGVPAVEPETVKLTKGQGKVLVMDDEKMVRDVLGAMLRQLTYEVDFASDGSQAIEKFVKAKEANQPFAAVILDLTIPGGMGGQEALERLLEVDPQVKAIVSSGYFDDPIMADFQKYGFTAVIAKPYKISELAKVLSKILTLKE